MSGIKLLHHIIGKRRTAEGKRRRRRGRPRQRRTDQSDLPGAEANPSEGPDAMATVTSGAAKSAAAPLPESFVAPAAISPIVRCES